MARGQIRKKIVGSGGRLRVNALIRQWRWSLLPYSLQPGLQCGKKGGKWRELGSTCGHVRGVSFWASHFPSLSLSFLGCAVLCTFIVLGAGINSWCDPVTSLENDCFVCISPVFSLRLRISFMPPGFLFDDEKGIAFAGRSCGRPGAFWWWGSRGKGSGLQCIQFQPCAVMLLRPGPAQYTFDNWAEQKCELKAMCLWGDTLFPTSQASVRTEEKVKSLSQFAIWR